MSEELLFKIAIPAVYTWIFLSVLGAVLYLMKVRCIENAMHRRTYALGSLIAPVLLFNCLFLLIKLRKEEQDIPAALTGAILMSGLASLIFITFACMLA